MKKIFMFIFILSLISCVEKPDKSVQTPEVKKIESIYYSHNTRLLQILHYSVKNIMTVQDSIQIYDSLCREIESAHVRLPKNDLATKELINYKINVLQHKSDSINQIWQKAKRKRDRYYRTKYRKKYRKDYQNWVASRIRYSNINLFQNINKSISQLKHYNSRLQLLSHFKRDSVLSKISTVKVIIGSGDNSQKYLMSYLIIPLPNNDFKIVKLLSKKLIN
jgi:hypothetical protein